MLNRVSRSLTFFWKDDRGLTAMLIVMALTLFVAVPLVVTRTTNAVLLPGLWSLLLVVGTSAVVRSRRAVVLVGALALAAMISQWGGYVYATPAITVIDACLAITSFAIFAGLILAQVFRPGRITIHRIVGSVAVYLLIGSAWSQAYRIVVSILPDAFNGIGTGIDTLSREATLLYFSFITLTTAGYGDITPLHPAARSLAMAEALVGQLFPAILIARLVSQELMSKE